MESTIKRVISAQTSCEDAKGEYCYCQCLGTFHGENHKPIRDRQLELKEKKEPLDKCNCVDGADTTNTVFLHQPSGKYFHVCRVCGGRIATSSVEGVVAFLVGKGIRIK